MPIKAGNLEIITGLNTIINPFRPAFSRQRSFDNFRSTVLGFM